MNQKEKDIYFLREAFKIARDLSQDKNTQVGAIIVNPLGEIISKGANRLHYTLRNKYGQYFPRELIERPAKYTNMAHAERDAIFNANREGKSLVGCTIYTTWSPCYFCAEVVINNGITRFVTHQSTTDWYNAIKKDTQKRKDWSQSIIEAIDTLQKNGLIYECLTEKIGGVEFLFDDKIRTP